MDLTKLKAEFPKSAIHWRAQTLTRNGDKAMALAYIDARDVMNRLDDVCGPANWQSEFTETAKGRVICRIGLCPYGDDWVWKSDGAGNTDVEGDKGAISDALKRAAVQWGVGRYLYDFPTPWVPCETYAGNDGRARFSKWADDPWNYVGRKHHTDTPEKVTKKAGDFVADIDQCQTLDALKEYWEALPEPAKQHPKIIEAKEGRWAELGAMEMHQGAG